MAKKDKNKKKKVRTSKQPISMVLVQNMSRTLPLTDKRMEDIYQTFRARCKDKSEHMYVDDGDQPTLLRLYMLGTKFNSTSEFLVKIGSFKPIKGKSKKAKGKEVGFTVELKSLLTPGKTHRLEVLREQHKATLYITL